MVGLDGMDYQRLRSLMASTSISDEMLSTSALFLSELRRQHNLSWDRVIEQAFEKHFGFPISEVRDQGSLELIRYKDSTIEDYRYRGEVFLQHEWPEDILVENDGTCAKVTMTSRYKEV